MTALDLYKHALIELNKIEAPSMLLEDYVYFINKAVQQYTNLTSAKLELDQQSLDDLRALKRTIKLEVKELNDCYYVEFPAEAKYLHLLNCIVKFKRNGISCRNQSNSIAYAARKLNPDIYTQIINNAYLKPDYKRPYYYISESVDIDSSSSDDWTNPDKGNQSSVQIEIIVGDGKKYIPKEVQIDYLKQPEKINLNINFDEFGLNSEDTTQVLEFSDYVCYEILNIFVRLVMENQSDPRIQTNIPLNNTIPTPLANTQQVQKE